MRVISPGFPNSEYGPDFRDAIIVDDAGMRIGDVEIHARSSDWHLHKHSNDPRYNGLVLHIAFEGKAEPVLLANGRKVPTIVIKDLLKGTIEEAEILFGSKMPICPLEGGDLVPGRARVFHLLGIERFEEKKAGFERELSRAEAQEVFYKALLVSLGFSENKRPFGILAGRIPLSTLSEILGNFPSSRHSAVIQALFLGAGRLLPSQRGLLVDLHEGALELEALWSELKFPEIEDVKWTFIKVRPYNFPTRRIAGASFLLPPLLKEDLLGKLFTWIEDIPPSRSGELRRHFIVQDEGFWGRHYDFGMKASSSTLVGEGRAGEMVVNVLLPFLSSLARRSGRREILRHLEELFRKFPSLPQNRITKRLLRLLPEVERKRIGACEQQGMLFLFQEFCLKGRCSSCPLLRRKL